MDRMTQAEAIARASASLMLMLDRTQLVSECKENRADALALLAYAAEVRQTEPKWPALPADAPVAGAWETAASLHDLKVVACNAINGDDGRTTNEHRRIARAALFEIVRRAEAAKANGWP